MYRLFDKYFTVNLDVDITHHNDAQITIMAGGVGSRFWPISTPDYSKQFFDVMGVGRSLIQLPKKSKDIYTLPAEFGWSDLGSWGRLRTLLPQDEDGNAKVGNDIRLYDCKNCVVHAADESKVARLGWLYRGREEWAIACMLVEGGTENKRF